jgi:predicted anti-sigma-YlaC factor YlaD
MRNLALFRYLPLALGLVGCSVNGFVAGKLGDALAAPSTVYASDDDPDLIAGAVPFSLKLIESTLASTPRHEGLLFAAASGFTQYAYAFVEQDADFVQDRDLDAATQLRLRARKLYARARDYGLRGLEVRHPGISARIRADPKAAVAPLEVRDVPLLYWTAASWGALMSLSKESPDAIADQSVVEALIDRAYALDERYDFGSIHALLITYEMARPDGAGDATVRSRAHFERALVLSDSALAGPYVSFAEAVCVYTQNREEFESMLHHALAIDVNARPEWRLANLIMQRRARWLLTREPDLFLGAVPADSAPQLHSNIQLR